MTSRITKEQAIAAYGGIGADLARALKITPSAVYQWPDGEPIPSEHELRLRYELKPQVFGKGAPTNVDNADRHRSAAVEGAAAQAVEPVLSDAPGRVQAA